MLWLLLLCTCEVRAQTPLEISGRVIEPGLRIPVPDADVRIWAYPTKPGARLTFYVGEALEETQTDANGNFRFTVPEAGRYRIAATKQGYGTSGPTMQQASSSIGFTLPSEVKPPALELFLARPASITGHLIDGDTKEPLEKRPLSALQLWYVNGELHVMPGGVAITRKDGEFSFPNLAPNARYLIQSPQILPRNTHLTTDPDQIDTDYLPTWWPGGTKVRDALPVTVASNGSNNIGTFAIRKQPGYRVQLTIPRESCTGHDDLLAPLADDTFWSTTIKGLKCGQTFVLRGFAPGQYTLNLATTGDTPADRRRAQVPILIGSENIRITAHLTKGPDVSGKIEAEKLPEKLSLLVISGEAQRDESQPTNIRPDGSFQLANLAPGDHAVTLTGLPPGYCIQDIRYNNTNIHSTTITVDAANPTQTLTITLSNKPTTITGTVNDRDKPLPDAHVRLIAYPLPSGPRRNWIILQTEADAQGHFTFPDLPSGEYRLVAVPTADRYTLEEPNVLENLAAKAETINLQPAGARNITLTSTTAKLTY